MTGDSVFFRVNGTPAPQGSKRHVGGGRMVEMSKAVGPWREAIRTETQRLIADETTTEATGSVLAAGAVVVTVTFLLGRPKGHYGVRGVRPSAPRYPAARPDLDKLVRAALDGLVMGGLLRDDSLVVGIAASKIWADGDPIGMEVEVTCCDNAQA